MLNVHTAASRSTGITAFRTEPGVDYAVFAEAKLSLVLRGGMVPPIH